MGIDNTGWNTYLCVVLINKKKIKMKYFELQSFEASSITLLKKECNLESLLEGIEGTMATPPPIDFHVFWMMQDWGVIKTASLDDAKKHFQSFCIIRAEDEYAIYFSIS